MGSNTHIQWCHHTYNPWRGCRKVADECLHCYITTTVPFRVSGQKHGADRTRPGDDYLKEPLSWNKRPWMCDGIIITDKKQVPCSHAAQYPDDPCPNEKCNGTSRRRAGVFCLSLGDWLDDENVEIRWFVDLLWTIWKTGDLDWLTLTKRPGNFIKRMTQAIAWLDANSHDEEFIWWIYQWMAKHPPHNVWLGVSAGADQAVALDIPAVIHFLSCEPMLKPIDTTHAHRFDWIIFGGESDTQIPARPCEIDWIQEGITFCGVHGIAPFVKQLGSNALIGDDDSLSGWASHVHRDIPRLSGGKVTHQGNGSRLVLKHKKGGDVSEWHPSLQVREFPKVVRY